MHYFSFTEVLTNQSLEFINFSIPKRWMLRIISPQKLARIQNLSAARYILNLIDVVLRARRFYFFSLEIDKIFWNIECANIARIYVRHDFLNVKFFTPLIFPSLRLYPPRRNIFFKVSHLSCLLSDKKFT